jgi:S-adenosylmethionine synthetase
VFPLTPHGIFEFLDHRRPIYREAAVFGYFGRESPDFAWEHMRIVDALRAAV